jgi:nucleotide-binding universal stress UspA family protein
VYFKVLVPLDGSNEAEKVFAFLQSEVSPEGEIILLQITPPIKLEELVSHSVPGNELDQMEENERHEAIRYLHKVTRQYGDDSDQWRCEAIVSMSVAERIVDIASNEEVDLIAMYIDDRELLEGLVNEGVTCEVERMASSEVRVFRH